MVQSLGFHLQIFKNPVKSLCSSRSVKVWPLPRMADWAGCNVHRLISQGSKLIIKFYVA